MKWIKDRYSGNTHWQDGIMFFSFLTIRDGDLKSYHEEPLALYPFHLILVISIFKLLVKKAKRTSMKNNEQEDVFPKLITSRGQKGSKKKTNGKGSWDVSILNPRWKLSLDMQKKLPKLVKEENTLNVSDGKTDKQRRFLQYAELELPTIITSEMLQQEAMDEIKIGSEDAATMTTKTRNDYFGPEGKERFYQVFRSMSRQMHMFTGSTAELQAQLKEAPLDLFNLEKEDAVDENEEGYTSGIFQRPLTARHLFAGTCIESQLPPSAVVILRRAFSPYIDLKHMSIGNEMAVVFAQCLIQIPMVTGINLCDNRLTDEGVGAIISCIVNKADLVFLDLSQNKVDGEAAGALARYVQSPSCSISDLVLSHADVDDSEVLGFTEALKTNRSLTSLNMSNNLLGNSESLNIVQPDLLTGGEAIAEMLTVNNTLTKLDLSWNLLRMNSAVDIGQSLSSNTGLRELNLAYNAFGNAGAQAIGNALLSNNCLEILNLANNNVPSEGAFVLAGALQSNMTLREMILDGNPLGSFGGRTLLQAVAESPNRALKLSLSKCNFDAQTSSKFNPDEATGLYDLVRKGRRSALQILNKIFV